MNKIFNELKKNHKLLKKSEHALERECLRINRSAEISKTPHPEEKLGAPLTNPHLSTDFSEPQLELITPVYKTEEGALTFLKNLHGFIQKNLPEDETLWPFSMPAKLPKKDKDIPIANYGNSNEAIRRTTYREGLSDRYGRKMQTISGIHYNFSFSEEFWQQLYKTTAPKSQSYQDFVTESYFRMIRNYLEISWLDSYLFGCAPATDKSYLGFIKSPLKKLYSHTFYGPHATSLRMSKFGYCCKSQVALDISFNSAKDYVAGLRKAIATPSGRFRKLKGLNNNVLQIPNEYYASVRPKQITKPNEDLLTALEERGVQYIEIRSADIDYATPIGVSRDHLEFFHIAMLYCLVKDNDSLSNKKHREQIINHEKVALYGRKPKLTLKRDGKKIELKLWAMEILNEMQTFAELLDKNYKDNRYQKNLEQQFDKVQDPELTPSAKLIKHLKDNKIEFLDYGFEISKQNHDIFLNQKLLKTHNKRFEKTAKESIYQRKLEEAKTLQLTEGYEDMERSTQLMIKAALKRGVKVDVLDRNANFVLLSKGKHKQYVAKATMTEMDSLMSYLVMENKIVTKDLLRQAKIPHPKGKVYNNLQDAVTDYPHYQERKIIIKPTTSNYGISIFLISKNSPLQYEKAVKEALEYDSSIIVEDYLEGQEYRFLIIGDKVLGVIKRIPANVIGDGKHSIDWLINHKNHNPHFLKTTKEYIRKGDIEKSKLKEQGFSLRSVPKKGKQVFLRDNSNISTGGDSIDVSTEIPEAYKKIALKAAQAADAKICGADMIIADLKAAPTKNNHGIIELNFNPVLKMHQYPTHGPGHKVGEPLLDFLGF